MSETVAVRSSLPTVTTRMMLFLGCVLVSLGLLVIFVDIRTEQMQGSDVAPSLLGDGSAQFSQELPELVIEDDTTLAAARIAERNNDQRLARSLYLSFLSTRSGPATEKEAFVLKRLGYLYQAQGHLALAEGFLEESVTTLVSALGSDHPVAIDEIKAYASTTNGLRLAHGRALPAF